MAESVLCREEVAVALSDQQDQPSWEAELCAHSSELLLLPSTAKTWGAEPAVSQNLGGWGPFCPVWTQEPIHGPWMPRENCLGHHPLTHTCELKAYLELHLKEEQDRGGKADQKWPLFFLLTIYVLSDLNYNTFNVTLILCELLWSGWAIVSIKVSGSMIWIIS